MEWTDFPANMGFRRYEISSSGFVRNKKSKYILNNTKQDYIYVKMTNDNNKSKSYALHILLAKVFVINPDPKTKVTVDHIDINAFNNDISNLRWATHSEQNLNKIIKIKTDNDEIKFIFLFFVEKEDHKLMWNRSALSFFRFFLEMLLFLEIFFIFEIFVVEDE